MMAKNRFTPSAIEKELFSIPLYQRLFEWDEEQIIQLLNDLYNAFKSGENKPYYIGMLTVHKDEKGKLSLVDGQQRFTALMLIGIASKGVVTDWEKFLKAGDEYRLSFFARKKDEEYLISKINHCEDGCKDTEKEYKNAKMESALAVIENFFKDKKDNDKEYDDEKFKTYMYEQTTFFVSELPTNYNSQDLNRYFEAMNETGKSLANHEILKVKLLQKLKVNSEIYTRAWNDISDMSGLLLNSENAKSLEEIKNSKACSFYNDKSNVDVKEFQSIISIGLSNDKPKAHNFSEGETSVVTFSYFLLQVLWLSLRKEQRVEESAYNFFNTQSLLETFDKYLLKENAEINVVEFYENLLKYRLMFDKYVIKRNSKNEAEVNYSIKMKSSDNDNNDKFDYTPIEKLIQYQSMLYVSIQPYEWLTRLLTYLDAYKETKEVSVIEILDDLKKWDNGERPFDPDKTSYNNINRYWFWKLDYYLWENANEHFGVNSKNLEIAKKYVFKRNRSIEHVSPQTPQSDSKIKISDEQLHSFGNLAMISAGHNSALQNESFEVKKAHVLSYINGSKSGSIESLKLLKIMENDTWGDELIEKHEKDMIGVLKSIGEEA